MSTLFIVATPIGNLKDISQRAIETLQGVDLILAEDTRHTKKLLAHYNIQTGLISYHQHSKLQKIDYIIDLLKQGKNLALVSDAGTPGISDPGNKLIDEVNKFALSEVEGSAINIIPIPGPSALIAALSISGFPADKFLFLGFPPAKKKRKQFFEEVINSKHTVVFYESCYRILRTLGDLRFMIQDLRIEKQTQVVVARELTKKFETIYRCTIDEVAKKIESDSVKGSIKGEFVVIIHNSK